MKKTYRLSVKIKNCDTVFKEGMEPGQLGSLDLSYDLGEDEYKSPMFIKNLMDQADELQRDLIELLVREVR